MTMYQNPILYADYSDPDVIRVGEDYYMVASSFTYLPGVPLLHSRDLVHWEIINYCVRTLPFGKYNKPSHGSGTWAPSIRFHDGIFYVFVPLPDEGIFVARSADPYGEFALNCLHPAKGWIDPCPLWDDDGKAYMVFAYANSRSGIKHRLDLVEIDTQCTMLLGEPVTIFDGKQLGPTTEGPKFYKHQGYYYILMPSGGVAAGWQSALRAETVTGPYEYRIVMHQGNTEVNGPHQGGWVTANDGRHWFVHFQDVTELGRITHLQPLCFHAGWPFIGSEQNGDGIGEPVKEWDLPSKGQPEYRIAQSDDFCGNCLGLQWQWQANPQDTFYSMNGHSGIRLSCLANPARENLLWYAPNALTQIPQQQAFSAVTKVKLKGKAGDMAVIGMIGHSYAYMGLMKTETGNLLVLYSGTVTQKEYEGEAKEIREVACPYEKDTVYLKVEVFRNKTYRFFWSADGIRYTAIGGANPLRRATWTGAKLCLWSSNKNNVISEGYGEYDFIHIEDRSNCETGL
ncbi:glycoside hydrolase 43 family protein [Lacrimispora sp.]|uniref:glycoside hydrolase family 43 protein n=1 Tax=Lacrimispora sp. TaxID=2719234 RepID=UPI00289A96B6|nr:glycoside hydrolase 43 family protein [Lacrimispora sp.]